MSFHELTRRGLIMAVAGFAAACQVRPVYMPYGSGGSEVVDAFRAIAIEAQTDRVGQALMNALIFEFRGGAELGPHPLYKLHLITTANINDLSIAKYESLPGSRLVALTVTYTLTEIVSGRVVDNGTVSATTAYDFSAQRYANVRAERDALDKTAKTAATEIRMRLSTTLAPKG